jgi:uncharacterized protein YqjF (DUF2071 family)
VSAPWVLAMDWRDALLLHWRADAAALRRAIPADLELDLYAGEAWISIVAFRIIGARARLAPPFAALPSFAEINVRTYVRDADKAGVWFFTLDAANKAAVWGGRTLNLNYLNASIACTPTATSYGYDAVRTDRRAAAARFTATARIDSPARIAPPNSLEHWLVERYCFFTTRHGHTKRGDVIHDPWLLHDATPTIAHNTLLSTANLTPLDDAPLTHASPGVSTRAWPLRNAVTGVTSRAQ